MTDLINTYLSQSIWLVDENVKKLFLTRELKEGDPTKELR